jgi:hypothetical protein
MEIKSNHISNTRLSSQKIKTTEFIEVSETVRWMCAMQAQDFSMAKWAIGARLSDPADKKIESAFNKGEILRIHVLRPTWHFISAEDVYWMLQLSAPKIKSSLKSRHKELELTESVITKTRNIIEDTLKETSCATREELANEFHKAKIRTDANRLSHILFRAELDGIICSGPIKENKLTYAMLCERVPDKRVLSREESLAELAKRYFTSRCPATLQDFIWWSNLSVKDAQAATGLLNRDFCTKNIGSAVYWIPNSFSDSQPKKTSAYLLPAYDEFLISYKDRSSSLSAVNNKKTVSDNGIFYPTIVVNGQVSGVWKRTIQKNKVIVETNFFVPPDSSILKLIDYKAYIFGWFLGKETELRFSS